MLYKWNYSTVMTSKYSATTVRLFYVLTRLQKISTINLD